MKKKIIVIIILILIIVAIIFGVNKINEQKIDYEITQIESYNYFKYKEESLYGVIDRDGNIIIEAKYQDVIIPNPEKDIFICTNSNEENEILNSSGETLFTEYDNVEAIKLKNIATVLCYEKSVLKYEKDGLYGLIDFEGNELTKNIYTSIENLQSTEGKFLVCEDEKYGVINLKGTVLVDTDYDSIQTDKYYSDEDGYTKSGFIVSTKNDDGYKYGYISYKGKTILDLEYSEISRISIDDENIYLIAAENGQYGLYKNSQELIETNYQSITYCDSGCLILQKNANYGIANLSGEIIVDLQYSNIEEKGIYLYAESSDGNHIYDADGNIIDMNFSKIVYSTDNENYRVTTLTNNDITYYGIEGNDGTELVSTTYRYIEYAFEDYFIAKDDNEKLGIINEKGEIIIDFDYDVIQKIKGKNLIQALNTETYVTEIYSKDLTLICSMENATLNNNNDDYIEIYNDDDNQYFDSDGNELSQDSEIIKNTFPDEIGDYEKVQQSLNEIYYE